MSNCVMNLSEEWRLKIESGNKSFLSRRLCRMILVHRGAIIIVLTAVLFLSGWFLAGSEAYSKNEDKKRFGFYKNYHEALIANDKAKIRELVRQNQKEVPNYVKNLLRASNAMIKMNMYTFPGVSAIEPKWATPPKGASRYFLGIQAIIRRAESIAQNYKIVTGDKTLIGIVTKHKKEYGAFTSRGEAWMQYGEGNTGTAIMKMWKAVNTFKETLNKEMEAIYLSEIGTMYVKIKKCSKGIGVLQESLNIFQNILEQNKTKEQFKKRRGKPPINLFIMKIHGDLGVFYSMMEMWDQAIIEFKKAIYLVEDLTKKYKDFNDILMDELMTMLSKSIQSKSIKSGPIFSPSPAPEYNTELKVLKARLYFNLGGSYDGKGIYKEAITTFKIALEFDPGLGEAHYNLSLYYYALKNYKLAIEHVDRAIELEIKVPPQFLKLLKPHRAKKGRM